MSLVGTTKQKNKKENKIKMNKLMIMFALMCACVCGFGKDVSTTVDVYDLKISASVPLLNSGIRSFKSVTMKGTMYMVYDGDCLSSTKLVFANTKTKVSHEIAMTNGFYNLMGKSTKYSVRSTPTVYFTGCDEDYVVGNEFIETMTMVGSGSLKTIKTTTTGCSVCGEPAKMTTVCNKLASMSGYVVGVMDCQCPDDGDWNHTLEAGVCGVIDDDLTAVRSHYAGFRGSWSAKWNKKLSDTETELANKVD